MYVTLRATKPFGGLVIRLEAANAVGQPAVRQQADTQITNFEQGDTAEREKRESRVVRANSVGFSDESLTRYGFVCMYPRVCWMHVG